MTTSNMCIIVRILEVVQYANIELLDPLFARLKARASSQRIMLKQLLRNYVEQGLNTAAEPLSNAALFELLDA